MDHQHGAAAGAAVNPTPHGVLGYLQALGVSSRKLLSEGRKLLSEGRKPSHVHFLGFLGPLVMSPYGDPSPSLLTWEQLPPGHGCCPVALVLHKSKAPVFGFVSCTGVDDDIHDAVRDLLHLC